jgi:hypothetical protein|nr:uncharacterized protein LOC107276878 isoform X1 [Oryza sativa Japonica Group]
MRVFVGRGVNTGKFHGPKPIPPAPPSTPSAGRRRQLRPHAAADSSPLPPPPPPPPLLILSFFSTHQDHQGHPLVQFSAPLLVPPLLLLQHCPRYRDPGSTEKIPLFSLVVHYRFYCNRPSCLSSKVYVAEHLPSRRSRTIHRTTVNLLSDHTKERTLQYRWA